MMLWLAIGMALAGLAAAAPLRWAAAIVVLILPLSGTVVLMAGGDPILLPLVVAVGFLGRHGLSLMNRPLREQFLKLAQTDVLLLCFLVYCVVSGVFFPRIFADATRIYPQVFVWGGVPLGPGHVSLVQLAYLFLGVWTYLALRQAMLRTGMEFILGAVLLQIGLFGGFAFLQAAAGLVGVSIPVRWIVNNAGYALLTEISEGGFVRVTSVFIEASYFAYWGSGALAFCYALYINKIFPRVSLALLAILGVALILSTSSTAYFGVLVVGVYGVIHAMLDTDKRRRDRGLVVILFGAVMALGCLAVVFTSSAGFAGKLRGMIESVTIYKGQSDSASIRTILSDSSVQNAADTYLLGTGYGSARSSGLVYQLLGTVGLPGMLLFVLAMWPLLGRAFRRLRTGEDAVSAAGSFALLATLAAMGVSGSDLALPNMIWAYAAIAAAPVAQRAAARARWSEMTRSAEPIEAGAMRDRL